MESPAARIAELERSEKELKRQLKALKVEHDRLVSAARTALTEAHPLAVNGLQADRCLHCGHAQPVVRLPDGARSSLFRLSTLV